MVFHIRKIKTASKSTAVQIVKYENRRRVVIKHIGSADNKLNTELINKTNILLGIKGYYTNLVLIPLKN